MSFLHRAPRRWCPWCRRRTKVLVVITLTGRPDAADVHVERSECCLTCALPHTEENR